MKEKDEMQFMILLQIEQNLYCISHQLYLQNSEKRDDDILQQEAISCQKKNLETRSTYIEAIESLSIKSKFVNRKDKRGDGYVPVDGKRLKEYIIQYGIASPYIENLLEGLYEKN